MSDEPCRFAGLSLDPASLKPAELLALAGLSAFSGYFGTQKLLGEKVLELGPMCVCERALYYYSLPENLENPASPRNTAGLRVAGLSEFQKITLQPCKTTHHPQIHAAVTGRSSVGEV